jgi:translation initiation factor IF-2
MLDEHGDNVEEAGPSRPVLVLGLTAVPGAGDNLMVVEDDRMARQIAERREARERNALLAQRTGRRTLEDFMSSMEKGGNDELLLILKGDGAGSVEALEEALVQLDVGDVNLRVIDRGVGAITETNVNLAAASDAIIIGFNVRPQGKATELADREGVEIRYYSVIYQAIEEIESASRACSSRSSRRPPSARRRSGRSSAPRRSATSPAAWSRRAPSAATPRCVCCATAPSWPTGSTWPASSGRRTTRARSARASSAVSC